MEKKTKKEIKKIKSLPILALSANAHNGLDWFHSLLDGHNQIIILPAFSFFRFLVREKISNDSLINKQTLCNYVTNSLYYKKSYQVPRRKFFNSLSEKKKFNKNLFIFFLHEEISIKNLFYGIHYAFLKMKKENILSKKIIVSHEHMCWNHKKYYIFKNVKFAFIIRDPRAAFAGSILQMKKVNQNMLLESHQMNKILLNFIEGWNFMLQQEKKSSNRIYFLINERLNKKLKKEMVKFSKFCRIKYNFTMLKSTFNKKKWKGETSYLMKKKVDINVKLPKNFYKLSEVKKRWMSKLEDYEIKIIESFCTDYMEKFKYKKIYKKGQLSNFFYKLNILFFYVMPTLNKKHVLFSYYLFKNILKRILVVLFPKQSIKVLSIK